MNTYTTRTEAIDREIIEALEAGAVEDARAEYDVDAIADDVLGGHEDGYALMVSEADFWTIVERYAR
ncbi:hypothetical protein [Kocuria sp.]|uniref:hypothetical protein n=1 Tax=Kocuria sp. TaxID=1871328 RepID=UPI0026DF8993|nr:hypothetical protein [Kocuria sp.]MDO5619309.1 hypothetical protein [Kocuria sp.]